jgi:excisionase family DNA binding protein
MSQRNSALPAMNMSVPTAVEPWLNARQAARFTGYTRRTIWAKAQAGEIPVHRIGRILRFRASELEAWMRANAS